MTEVQLISINQVLQLLGLGPCLLLMSFLLLTIKRLDRVIIPLLFLLSLSAGFITALELIAPMRHEAWTISLLICGSLLPAAAFLLIIQFVKERTPPELHAQTDPTTSG